MYEADLDGLNDRYEADRWPKHMKADLDGLNMIVNV